ncbi:MAG: TIGR02757 family protein [Flammeovirgaceae bacterium]
MNMTEKKRQYIISLKGFLEEKGLQFNQRSFIENDPVCIPHHYKKKQDIEIAALIASVLAWGQRVTVINKAKEFLSWMEGAPHDFVLHHRDSDLKPFVRFKHRTFNGTDALYFIKTLRHAYQKYPSLEYAFPLRESDLTTEAALTHFHHFFFSLDLVPVRTKKHISNPARNTACKRLNMFLRWMVRQDDRGVDFGLWKKIKPHQLVCPLDVHVERVAYKLNLLKKQPASWKAAVELTNTLKLLDPADPVKYDFALFGIGVEGEV